MPVSLARVPFGTSVFCVLAMAGSIAAAQEPQEQPSRRFKQDKTIDVEIKIVPFYAVDADGRPVYDLKREEVEIRVGGVPVPVETFDRYSAPAEGALSQAAAQAPPTSRNVFFLFDVEFSSPTGLDASRQLAASLVADWPGADWLHLIVNHSKAGLASRLGPVAADPGGKQKLLAEIEDLKPEVRRLHLGLDSDFGPTVGGIGASAKASGMLPGSQMEHNYDALRGSSRGEYHGAARELAESMEALAAKLRRLPGPKLLLIFSQGVDPGLYFDGDSGNGVGSDESTRVDTRRAPPLLDRFKEPLEALADSGVMTLYVNTTQQALAVNNSLRHMAETSGGLYLDGVDRRGMKRRIAASTAAYYEAGFYNLLLLPPRNGKPAQIVQFDRREGVAADGRGALDTTVEATDAYVWGIVAVDPETEQAWYRRLSVQPGSGKK